MPLKSKQTKWHDLPDKIVAKSRASVSLALDSHVITLSKADTCTILWARIGTTRVNWREVCVNPSWRRAMSVQEFWNVQSFGHDRI